MDFILLNDPEYGAVDQSFKDNVDRFLLSFNGDTFPDARSATKFGFTNNQYHEIYNNREDDAEYDPRDDMNDDELFFHDWNDQWFEGYHSELEFIQKFLAYYLPTEFVDDSYDFDYETWEEDGHQNHRGRPFRSFADEVLEYDQRSVDVIAKVKKVRFNWYELMNILEYQSSLPVRFTFHDVDTIEITNYMDHRVFDFSFWEDRFIKFHRVKHVYFHDSCQGNTSKPIGLDLPEELHGINWREYETG